MLIDTHAHLQFPDCRDELDDILERAHTAGVDKIIISGTNETDSAEAVAIARAYENIWATVSVHPHDADRGYEALEEIARLAGHESVVGIGECGLDNYRSETSPEDQERAFRFQVELGLSLRKPLVFHVRDAFPDFWRILDDYPGVRGVVHCFSAGVRELEGSLDRGLFIALGGIMTFTKDPSQLEAARRVPQGRLVLETDAPYLAPPPHRGKPNEPAYLADTARLLAELRGEPLEDLVSATTRNAEALFGI